MPLSRRLFVMTAATAAASGTAPGLPLTAPASAAHAPAVTASAPVEPAYRIPVGPDDAPEDLVRKASLIRPTERQIAWQRRERTALLHFGVWHGQQIERLVVEAQRAGAWVRVATAGTVGRAASCRCRPLYGRGAGGSG
ncbi:hypothetical protein [Streptomyces ossamyceticus]|uniref:hypothetical protein n=1 Tax=Streptomyces ossamyceticus TaxID=249581 RepID=UPI003EBF4672